MKHIISKYKILILFISVVAFGGCDQIDSLTKFNLDYDQEVIIPSTTIVDVPIDIFTPEIESNSESKFAVNDTKKEFIEQISLKSMKLVLTSPDDKDFSFLNAVSVYINAEGLDEKIIASMEDIPYDAGKELDLETSSTDLQEFIKKDKFTLRVKTITDEIITSDHHIDVHSVFFVDAKIFGI